MGGQEKYVDKYNGSEDQNPNEGILKIWWKKFVEKVRRISCEDDSREPWFRGNVSRIHLYEGRERYYSLKGMLDFYEKIYNLGSYWQVPANIPENCKEHVRLEKLQDKEKALETINICRKTLDGAKQFLTRKQGDLNNLWRSMTRVRIMLTEYVIPQDTQASQLYFCHEEAYRLAISDETQVKEMLQRLAEHLDEKSDVQKPQFKCLLRALLERFNTLRTGRIHQQYINIKTYKTAFAALMVTALFLIFSAHVLFPEIVKESVSFPALEIFKAEQTAGDLKKGLYLAINLFLYPLGVFQNLLKDNIFAFIFFGGLIGGFFSVATRQKLRDRKPGEDAYFVWYVLSKPFVGAFGAIILFLLIQSGFVKLDILGSTDGQEIKRVVAFSFAFVSGFSERIVFPSLR